MIRFEMIFVIIAGIFLGTLILNENSSTMTTADDLALTQTGIDALTLANSYMDRMTGMAHYDEFLIDHAVEPTDDPVAKLALLGTIGREAGETSSDLFDDVDDFNGFDTVESISSSGQFHVRCSVAYCDSLGRVMNHRSWTKLVSVSVTDTVIGRPNESRMRLGGVSNDKMTIRKKAIVSYFKFM
jgi:hypothetical protein